jgi:hypothetical protein
MVIPNAFLKPGPIKATGPDIRFEIVRRLLNRIARQPLLPSYIRSVFGHSKSLFVSDCYDFRSPITPVYLLPEGRPGAKDNPLKLRAISTSHSTNIALV